MPRVVNMTCLCYFKNQMPLKHLGESDGDFHYDPRRFSAARYKSLTPRYSALVFANGKVVLTGIVSLDGAYESVKHLTQEMERLDIKPVFDRLVVKNYVAAMDLGLKVDLVKLYYVLKGQASYETELFPGLIFKPKTLPVTITVFTTGKVNITGINQSRYIKKASNLIKLIVSNYQSN